MGDLRTHDPGTLRRVFRITDNVAVLDRKFALRMMATLCTLRSFGGALGPSTPLALLSPKGERKGEHVDSSVKPEGYTLEFLGRIILGCGCGEKLILLGLEEDWRSEQRTEFECSCGKGLTLSDRLNADVLFRRVMRGV